MEQRLVNTDVGYGLESLGFISQFTASGMLPAYYSMISAGSSSRTHSHRGRKLTIHLHLLLRLKTSGPVSLASFTTYLHNKGRDCLVILNTLFGLMTKSKAKCLVWSNQRFL